ncbi:MAG TPA: chemotaxis protein CheW [Gemmatimonadaceae bacterium]|nr:chemotaxis protein CheW [Gemmatimonadaceae bacterium]
MASIESTPELELHRFLLFGVAGRLCACELGAVREIIASRPATRLPGAPAWVRGLINLRGTLVTVVDLAVRFGAADAGGSRSIVVVEAEGKAFGIGVDEVRDVQSVAADALEPVDAQRAAGGIVSRLAHVGGAETALIVDVGEIARTALVV